MENKSMASKIRPWSLTVKIATIAAAVAVSLGMCCLFLARRAGSGEATTSSRYYKLPHGPKNVLRYAATTSIHENLGGPERRGMARIQFAVWLDEKSPKKAVLYFSDYDVSIYRGKEKLDRHNRKNVVGKSGRFDFDPTGSDSFTLQMPADASHELKELGETVSRKILPLLFPKLPDDFSAKKGFSWERSIKTKNGDKPALTKWTIIDSNSLIKWKPLILMTAQAHSKQAPKGISRHHWRRWSVYYDAAAKRVRYATNERLFSSKVVPENGDLLRHSDAIWTITELPGVGAK
jgi:hypothetical protein